MMSTEKNTSRHFKIFSDCVLVKGAKSSAIYDLSRHRMVLFPTEYFDFISSLDGRNPDLSGDLYSSDAEVNRKFNAAVDYLIKSEVAAMVSERSHFTALSGSHDRPSKINNSIIDISSTWHDFSNIFAELDQLGCEFVQVRIFSSEYTLDKIYELVAFASDTTVRGIDFLICHKPEYMPSDLVEFVSKNPLVAGLVVHSSPMDLTLEVDRADAKALGFGTRRRVRFITQPISSDAACGKITIDTISAPSVRTSSWSNTPAPMSPTKPSIAASRSSWTSITSPVPAAAAQPSRPGSSKKSPSSRAGFTAIRSVAPSPPFLPRPFPSPTPGTRPLGKIPTSMSRRN